MIALIKEIPKIKPNVALAKILCHHAAYGEYEKIALFWAQYDENKKITAIISLVDNVCTLYFDNGDAEEMTSFLRMLSPRGVFTDKATAELLGLKAITDCTVLLKKPPHENPNKIENVYRGVMHVCDILSERLNIGDKQALYADIVHRINHNCAATVSSDNSAGAIIFSGDIAVINGIAVKENMASKGLGSATLNRLLDCVRGRSVFVCAEAHNVPFYIKNGFEKIDLAVYSKLG